MRYRQLGSTGIEVSEIGFGAWGIGGNKNGAVAYGPVDAAEARLALLSAVDAGVTLFDTADFYGFGHSESVLGETLKPHRNRVVLATKCGMLDAAGTQDFSPQHMHHALESSLQRLQTDYVDLYQLHSPPIDLVTRGGDILATLEAMKQAGKIRAYGISVRSPEDGLVAVKDLGFDCLQTNFNLIDQRALDSGLLSLCEARGAGIIARTPLVFGFLTGQYAASDNFAPDDHRRRWTPEQRAQWAAAPKLFEPLIAGEPQTPSQFALRFCLSFPAVSATIPGMLIRQHVAENTAASDLGTLPITTREQVVTIYRKNTFFSKKS
jgi:aryl-alcohol dehydrogenase-like predicted oxidoreductase